MQTIVVGVGGVFAEFEGRCIIPEVGGQKQSDFRVHAVG